MMLQVSTEASRFDFDNAAASHKQDGVRLKQAVVALYNMGVEYEHLSNETQAGARLC